MRVKAHAQLRIEYRSLRKIKPLPRNAKKHDLEEIIRGIQLYGFVDPIGVNEETSHDVDGNGRLEALIEMKRRRLVCPAGIRPGPKGTWEAPIVRGIRVPKEKEEAFALELNRTNERGGVDESILAAILTDLSQREEGLAGTGYEAADLTGLLARLKEAAGNGSQASTEPVVKPSLFDRFLVPPFSVLDARQGYWQARKQQWLALGIKSELGRGQNLIGRSLHEIAAMSLGGGTGSYDAAKAWIEERRALNQTDGEILAELAQFGLIQTPKMKGKPDNTEAAIPGFYRELNRRVKAGASKEEAKAAIIAEHVGRGAGSAVTAPEGAAKGTGGTSVFDPVLCELAYRWFCPPKGQVLDPFAGGSVRGVVAEVLGRKYTGVDLSKDQVTANRKNAKEIKVKPTWIVGDSVKLKGIEGCKDIGFDFLFTCPPYFDLEVYSEDPADISTMPWTRFLSAYKTIIANATALLKPNRFACFVVGEVRGEDGIYRSLVPETIRAIQDCGLRYYNECILITVVGTLPIRVGKFFDVARKLGKTHQNVLVFVKGDPRKATEAIGPLDLADPTDPSLSHMPAPGIFGEKVTAADLPNLEA